MRIVWGVLFFGLMVCGEAVGQRVLIDLQSTGEVISGAGYRFVEVLDLREQRSMLGEVHDGRGNRVAVGFRESLDRTVLRFLQDKLARVDGNPQDIQVRMTKLDLQEKLVRNSGLYEGTVEIEMGFYVKGEGNPAHLVDFSGAVQYRRSAQHLDRIGQLVSGLFQNSLDYFHSWITDQAESHRSLARTVRLELIDQSRTSTGDTVYYHRGRPLEWKDFQDRPDPRSRYNATIFTSFSIQGNSVVEAGAVVQTVEVSVYMLPDQSWAKHPTGYGLNHEQRHFDVTRIVADRLIYRLGQMELEPSLYQAKLNDAYLDAYREMNRLQEAYDRQTRHGLDSAAQARWNTWIDQALDGDWEPLEEVLQKVQRSK